jgi:alginate O-acetyltransferase complex protein AlgI
VLFSSYVFVFCLLPVAVAGYFALARLGRLPAALWLVATSFVFYGWWNPAFVPLLMASIAFNYALARLIGRTGATPRLRSALLGAGIAGDLAALFYFKYLASVLGFLHIGAFADPLLPLGISFFTFTQIGFLIDVRQGAADETGLLNYVLFVTFFPHLIAGPVLHHREIMPQFAAPATYRFSVENVAVGLAIFSIGLAKKTLFADQLSPIAVAGFAHPGQLALLPAWEAALAYSLQLYFDFSGYSDMAIGIARLFNVRFPVNFNSPYKAQSVIDYWQRWHMTLTRYLTLYIYTPLALRIARGRAARGLPMGRHLGFRGFAVAVLFPTFLTMTVAGVWHGSGVTFLVFGLLHAAYLSVNHAWRIFRPSAWKPARGRLAVCRRVLLTYLCVLVGAVVFRAASLGDAAEVLSGMIGLHGIAAGGPTPERALTLARDWALIGCLGALALGAPNSQQIMRDYAPVLGRVVGTGWAWRPSLGWAMAFGCLGALGLLAIGGSGEFLYYQF